MGRAQPRGSGLRGGGGSFGKLEAIFTAGSSQVNKKHRTQKDKQKTLAVCFLLVFLGSGCFLFVCLGFVLGEQPESTWTPLFYEAQPFPTAGV